MPSKPQVHYLRPGHHKTACGLRAKQTRKDTRLRAKVTCMNCKRVLRAESSTPHKARAHGKRRSFRKALKRQGIVQG